MYDIHSLLLVGSKHVSFYYMHVHEECWIRERWDEGGRYTPVTRESYPGALGLGGAHSYMRFVHNSEYNINI